MNDNRKGPPALGCLLFLLFCLLTSLLWLAQLAVNFRH